MDKNPLFRGKLKPDLVPPFSRGKIGSKRGGKEKKKEKRERKKEKKKKRKKKKEKRKKKKEKRYTFTYFTFWRVFAIV